MGELSASDPDVGDRATFALVVGEGAADNAAFTIVTNVLRTAAVFDYETRTNYGIRVEAVDRGGLRFAKPLTITVTDTNDPPVLASIPRQRTAMGQTTGLIQVRLDDQDMGDLERLKVTFQSSDARLVRDTAFRLAGGGGTRLLRVTPEPGQIGTVELTLTATDPRGASGVSSFPLEVYSGPQILVEPVGWTVADGDRGSLDVVATSQQPETLRYAWHRLPGLEVVGAAARLHFAPVRSSDSAQYVVTVSDDLGSVTSRVVEVTVVPSGPRLLAYPVVAQESGNLVMGVSVAGTPPLSYRWRRNNVNLVDGPHPDTDSLPLLARSSIQGATGSVLTLRTLTRPGIAPEVVIGGATNSPVVPNFQPPDAGEYTVLVANDSGVIGAVPILVSLQHSDSLPWTDRLVDAPPRLLTAAGGLGVGSTRVFSTDTEEQALRPGNRSGSAWGWLAWRAGADGAATFTTAGSAFDTLLAVYEPSRPSEPLAPENLRLVVSDDDSGGSLTSHARFNAIAGTEYYIAVADRSGAGGNVILSWLLEPGQGVLVITDHPESLAVDPSVQRLVRFVVAAEGGGAGGYVYEWRQNGVPLGALDYLGTNTAELVIARVDATKVGSYTVRITSADREVESVPATLELVTGSAQDTPPARNKAADLFAEQFLGIRGLSGPEDPPGRRAIRLMAASVAAGSITLTTQSVTGQQDETSPCGGIGGASAYKRLSNGVFPDSRWVTVVTATNDSGFDPVLTVYATKCNSQGCWDDKANRILLACDDNSADDGTNARVRFLTSKDMYHVALVDGRNGTKGKLTVLYSDTLDTEPTLRSLDLLPEEDGIVVMDTARHPLSQVLEVARLADDGVVQRVNVTVNPRPDSGGGIYWFPVQNGGQYSVLVNIAGVTTPTQGPTFDLLAEGHASLGFAYAGSLTIRWEGAEWTLLSGTQIESTTTWNRPLDLTPLEAGETFEVTIPYSDDAARFFQLGPSF